MYELYYEKEAISKELYDWLLKNGYADAMLIAKWKKTGYEKVSSVPIVYERRGRRLMYFVVMLSALRANERDELQLNLHMPGTESPDEGGSGDRVRKLWMQRVRFQRLRRDFGQVACTFCFDDTSMGVLRFGKGLC